MHNVEYFTYPEKVNRKSVQQELDHYAAMEDWQEGCQGLYRDIRWLDHEEVLSDRMAAESFIEKADRGNYDQIAVRYYAAEPCASAKLLELEKKRDEAYDIYLVRIRRSYPVSLTSAFLGCKSCGSRLSVKHLSGNNCPVCGNDLRPEYIMNSIKAAKAKWERASAAVKDYIDKHAKKRIYWLVKIEYHT